MKQNWHKSTPSPKHKNNQTELEASTHLPSEILQSPFQGISGGKPPVTPCAQGKSVEELHVQLWAHSFKLHPVI